MNKINYNEEWANIKVLNAPNCKGNHFNAFHLVFLYYECYSLGLIVNFSHLYAFFLVFFTLHLESIFNLNMKYKLKKKMENFQYKNLRNSSD